MEEEGAITTPPIPLVAPTVLIPRTTIRVGVRAPPSSIPLIRRTTAAATSIRRIMVVAAAVGQEHIMQCRRMHTEVGRLPGIRRKQR